MKHDFQKLVSRRMCLLLNDHLVKAWANVERFTRLTGLEDYVRDLLILDADFYVDMTRFDALVQKYGNKPNAFFWNFVNNGYVHGARLCDFAQKLATKKDLPTLQGIFWESSELLQNLLVFLPQTHTLAKAIEHKVVAILKKKGIEESRLNEVLLLVTVPDKLNGPGLEARDLRKIKEKMATAGFDVNKAVKKHAEKYAYLGYREPFSEGYTDDFFRKRLEELPPEQNIPKHGLRFDKEEKEIVNLMKEFVYFRNYRTERLYEAVYHLENLWKALAHAYQLGETDLGYYLLDEAKALFESKAKVNPAIIAERRKGYGIVLENGVFTLITGKELQRRKQELEKHDATAKELQGMVACKGKATGTVKVILKASEQAKIKDGDVLVTSMTTPDFLPAMKRAAAFVTDEGGITCHAAIVSRELNKPCIIGTKVATKVFKDGDMVEVDAEKGVVRKV